MSRAHTEAGDSRITTDRETIRGWVGEHDAIPVRYAGTEGESGRLRIVPETQVGESNEELAWDEFFETLEGSDQVVVYHGTDHPEPFEVIERHKAVGRSTLEDDSVEEALIEGETVESEVRETTVIERTIVEEVTVESEVREREMIDEEIVDAELLTREVVECTLSEGDVGVGHTADGSVFEPGSRSEIVDGLEVELIVDEGWSLTKEVSERLTIESRAVDADVTETDTVEADTVQSAIDIDGVQGTVVESDLVDTDATGVDVVGSGTVESEYGEGEVVETRLLERKTVDEEVSLRRRLTGEISEGETIESDTIHREVVESEIVGGDDVEGGAAAAGAGTAPEMGVEDEAAGAGETAATPSDDDEGKTVVDATGEKVGMVVEVEGDTVYVDPHPSLTDRIRLALGWGEPGEDDDTYPIEPGQIAKITGTQVELAAVEPGPDEESEERRDES